MRLKKRVDNLELRVDNLELGELQDLLNMKKMSDHLLGLEKQLGDVVEMTNTGLESVHKVLIGLL